jgi:hypothetical protein
MSVEYIETADHVFRAEFIPGDEVPGHCRRRLTITVESGPPITEAEALPALTQMIASMVADGIDVVSWGVVEEES